MEGNEDRPKFLRNKCNEKEMTISHLEAIIEKQRSEINSHVESCTLIYGGCYQIIDSEC